MLKQFKRVFPVWVATVLVVQGFYAGSLAFADSDHYYQGRRYDNQSWVHHPIVKAGAIGAGVGAVTGILNGRHVLRNAAVGAVVGAGAGAIYRTVQCEEGRVSPPRWCGHSSSPRNRYNHDAYWQQADNMDGRKQSYGYDANYNNYPNPQQGYYNSGSPIY